jgi:hypothetical protein
MEWGGSTNDFIPYNITRKRADLYAAGDYDYQFITWHGLASEHATMCNNGTWDVLTGWLGDMKRTVDPPRVTYVRNPLMDDPGAGLVGNRAYWLSGIETRHDDLGTIDVTSGGLGLGPAPVPDRTLENSAVPSDGITLGSSYDQPYHRSALPANPYTREYRHPGPPVPQPATDTMAIAARNIRTVVIDVQRARVTCGVTLEVQSDGPLTVELLGCTGSRSVQSFGR